MKHVITIGNAIIDSFLSIEEGNKHSRFDRETGEIAVVAGAKIPLSSAVFELGGNACNASVALSRLGLRSGLVAEIGNDSFADTIILRLKAEHVDISHLIATESVSSFAVGIQLKGDRTLLVHHVERKHDFVYDDLQTEWVYLSSMGDNWRHVYREVPAWVKRAGIKLAFNPGTRQIAAGHEAIGSALATTDLLFLNKEEAERVVRGREDRDEESAAENREEIHVLAKKLQGFGAKTVVITDGRRGAFALEADGNFIHQPVVHSGEVVERTGAGDGFSSTVLAAIIYGHDMKTALLWGAVNAGYVVKKIGAQPGLLTKEQLERRVKEV